MPANNKGVITAKKKPVAKAPAKKVVAKAVKITHKNKVAPKKPSKSLFDTAVIEMGGAIKPEMKVVSTMKGKKGVKPKTEIISVSTDFVSPVYNVLRVPIERIKANDYNPNAVAPPEMALLETSIWEDGFTQPIVTYYDKATDIYIVVDGFHRYTVGKTSKRIFEREQGTLPIVVIDKALGDRMASTIRHNRARGSHNIELMSTIVAELVEMGKGDHWISKHIGMSPDEILRLKQITGVAALFKNRSFSDSWNAEMGCLDDEE